MLRYLLAIGWCLTLASGELGADNPAVTPSQLDSIVLPNPTNAVQFRIYTNAAPTATHLVNTFDVDAYGVNLLRSPGGAGLAHWLGTTATNQDLHSVLVNGVGPTLAATNSLRVIEQTSGPDWQFVLLDASPAYRGRVEQYRRGVLYVAPDLFVVHDHVMTAAPMNFQMQLHPPAATRIDPNWQDLRLNQPEVGLQIVAPSRKILRSWQQITSPTDNFFPGTITTQVGPTNQLSQVDMITVFAIRPGGLARDYFAFKLVESNTAVGARIHRAGRPTLVAFRLDAAAPNSSLDTFKFSGPAGVSVFRAKPKTP